MNGLRNNAMKAALLLALGGALAVTASALWFSRTGGAFLERRDYRIAELTLGEAERLDEAGFVAEAVSAYDRALAGTFAGPDKRAYAQRRYGQLLHRMGIYRAAAKMLLAAAEGPQPDRTGLGELTDALLRLQRWGEAEAALERWRAEQDDPNDTLVRALQRCADGRLAEGVGDLDRALDLYNEAERLNWKSGAGFYAGRALRARGELPEAALKLERHLLDSPSTENADEAGILLGHL